MHYSRTRIMEFQIDGESITAESYGLSTSSSHSAEILPELRPPNFPNEPNADNPLKLLLPSLVPRDFLDVLGFDGLDSNFVLLSALISATTSSVIWLRQKGQTGAFGACVVRVGLLWQQRARVQLAHIWCPHVWTSIVHIRSKQMPHRSTSLACLATLFSESQKASCRFKEKKKAFLSSISFGFSSFFAIAWQHT